MTLSPDHKSIARILRVNHAGEFGAIRIYAAQGFVSRLLWTDVYQHIAELRSHEVEHCRIFKEAMPSRSARPCRAMWLWSNGGYLLGLASCLLGKKGVWSCTEAVEETVHEHLSAQINFLEGRDDELALMIADIQLEEEGHLHLAQANKGEPSLFSDLLDRAIRRCVHLLVWLSTNGDSARMSRELRGLSV